MGQPLSSGISGTPSVASRSCSMKPCRALGFILCMMRVCRREDYSKNQVKTHLSVPSGAHAEGQAEAGHRNAGGCKPALAQEPGKARPQDCVRWLVKTWGN